MFLLLQHFSGPLVLTPGLSYLLLSNKPPQYMHPPLFKSLLYATLLL